MHRVGRKKCAYLTLIPRSTTVYTVYALYCTVQYSTVGSGRICFYPACRAVCSWAYVACMLYTVLPPSCGVPPLSPIASGRVSKHMIREDIKTNLLSGLEHRDSPKELPIRARRRERERGGKCHWCWIYWEAQYYYFPPSSLSSSPACLFLILDCKMRRNTWGC